MTEEDKAKICDDYCRYPWMVTQQEVLDIICDGCPLGRDSREEKQE